MRARELAVGSVPCTALRVTYVGELGWELYCPMEFGLRLWDELWAAGRGRGLVAGGYRAIRDAAAERLDASLAPRPQSLDDRLRPHRPILSRVPTAERDSGPRGA
jgi:glycine cleavage system aminomethyltransferase T